MGSVVRVSQNGLWRFSPWVLPADGRAVGASLPCGVRDGAKSTIRPLCGQALRAARPEGRPVDDIDDADDVDDPRTEGRRHKVRAGSETPFRARRPKGNRAACGEGSSTSSISSSRRGADGRKTGPPGPKRSGETTDPATCVAGSSETRWRITPWWCVCGGVPCGWDGL